MTYVQIGASVYAEQAGGRSMITGHTCGDACWHARDIECRCSCGGRNHGIMARGGDQPERIPHRSRIEFE